MVETICPSCGNRKSFEDSYVGKTFKCPNCNNPVTIQNVGSQLNTEPLSQTNSFADEIARAEAEKKRQDEEATKKQLSDRAEFIAKGKRRAKITLVICVPLFLYYLQLMSMTSERADKYIHLHPFLDLILFIISGVLIITSFIKLFKK